MSLLFRVATIIPAGYPGYDGTPYDKAYWASAGALVEDAIRQNRAWVERETGHTYEYEHTLHYSNKTLIEMATENPAAGFAPAIPWWDGDNPNQYPGAPHVDLSGNMRAPIPEGQGVSENRVWHDVLVGDASELKWPKSETGLPNRRDYRHGAIVIGAGGYAGGRSGSSASEDYGEFVWGDWFIRLLMTGKGDPACMAEYHNYQKQADGTPKLDAQGHWIYDEKGFCNPDSGNVFGSLGHELLHGWNVDSHFPIYLNLGTPWSEVQKADFIAKNAPFLTKMAGGGTPPPEPIPVPPTVVGLRVEPALTQLRVGGTVQLRCRATMSNGAIVEVAPAWSSADPTKATVTPTGLVTARRQGGVVITARFEGQAATGEIQVRRKFW